jgi:hypothetical protein
MTTCPRCREPLASGQEYCLVCGARLSAAARRSGSSLRSSWTLRSLAAAVVALVGAAAAIAATASDGGGGQAIVTAIGDFAAAPESTTGESPVGPSAVTEWPTGEDGWTIALVSLPQTGGRPAALARARAARARGLPQVGILDSSRYASLHPGYWTVFSGVYASEAEATSALEEARRYARSAMVRRIVP